MIVLDTHALVWWVNEPSKLSRRVLKAVDEAAGNRHLFVSVISAWEIAMLVKKERLVLALDVRDWIARCEALPFLSFVPVSTALAVESVRLTDFTYADPADRIIVATAMSLGARLATKDEKLAGYQHIKTIW